VTASRLLPIVIAVFATTACDTVEFQSAPDEPLADCDAALVGDWLITDLREGPRTDGRQYLRVDSGCERWFTVAVERKADGSEEIEVDDLEEDLVLGFARTSTQAFIAARDRPKDGDANSPSQDKPDGYTLVAWDRHEDASITLRLVDLRKTSHLIIDGKVPGWVEKRDRRADGSRDGYVSTHWAFVFGSAAEVRTLLEAHDLLDAPWMRLEPTDAQDSAQINAWLAGAPAVQPEGHAPGERDSGRRVAR